MESEEGSGVRFMSVLDLEDRQPLLLDFLLGAELEEDIGYLLPQQVTQGFRAPLHRFPRSHLWVLSVKVPEQLGLLLADVIQAAVLADLEGGRPVVVRFLEARLQHVESAGRLIQDDLEVRGALRVLYNFRSISLRYLVGTRSRLGVLVAAAAHPEDLLCGLFH